MNSAQQDLLILASASPRRRELLARAGVEFEIIPTDSDESFSPDQDPSEVAKELAERKARAASLAAGGQRAALGADTIVVLETDDGHEILGKPSDDQHARQMLRQLSGRVHLVITGYCLCRGNDSVIAQDAVSTEVLVSELSDELINAYVESGEASDMAGSYAIQGIGGAMVKEIRGSYSNVVGLPVAEVLIALEQAQLWSPKNIAQVKPNG